MIAVSEIGKPLLAVSDNGYNVIVGSTAEHPVLFASYADHPHKVVKLSETLYSSAAGRYQILAKYYDIYKRQLGLPDFGKDSQDKIALQLINECRAIPDITAGNIPVAIAKCSSRWASLPGANYPGQHMNKLDGLLTAFYQAGGGHNA
jgi:muramidase (phage lysozyme)